MISGLLLLLYVLFILLHLVIILILCVSVFFVLRVEIHMWKLGLPYIEHRSLTIDLSSLRTYNARSYHLCKYYLWKWNSTPLSLV